MRFKCKGMTLNRCPLQVSGDDQHSTLGMDSANMHTNSCSISGISLCTCMYLSMCTCVYVRGSGVAVHVQLPFPFPLIRHTPA